MPPRSPKTFRFIRVADPTAELPCYEWVNDGSPSAEHIAIRKGVVDAHLAKLEVERARLKTEADALLSYTEVVCTRCNDGPGCGKKSYIRDLVYIQTLYYVEPSGCSGGDYWVPGEGNFDCAHCGQRNRLYKRKDIQALRDFGITDEEDDR